MDRTQHLLHKAMSERAECGISVLMVLSRFAFRFDFTDRYLQAHERFASDTVPTDEFLLATARTISYNDAVQIVQDWLDESIPACSVHPGDPTTTSDVLWRFRDLVILTQYLRDPGKAKEFDAVVNRMNRWATLKWKSEEIGPLRNAFTDINELDMLRKIEPEAIRKILLYMPSKFTDPWNHYAASFVNHVLRVSDSQGKAVRHIERTVSRLAEHLGTFISGSFRQIHEQAKP